MNIQEYISSGIIEACALGTASDHDMQVLESLSGQYPEIKQAFEDYKKTLENFAGLHAAPPPVFLKNRIWSAIEDERKASGKTKTALRSKNLPFMRYEIAASLLLLAGSILLNFIFWNKSRNFESRLSGLEQKHQNVIALNRDYETRIRQYQDNLRLFLNPSVRSIPLSGVEGHSENNAMVLWDTKSGEVYLSLENLPIPPSGKQYQLWAIVDGKPVNAGVYALSATSLIQKMKRVPKAQMFAVTLEQKGGVSSPTMSEMYVAGKI